MVHLICLTKTYNANDIEAWLQYHSKFIDSIWLLDNESPVGHDVMENLVQKYVRNILALLDLPTSGHFLPKF